MLKRLHNCRLVCFSVRSWFFCFCICVSILQQSTFPHLCSRAAAGLGSCNQLQQLVFGGCQIRRARCPPSRSDGSIQGKFGAAPLSESRGSPRKPSEAFLQQRTFTLKSCGAGVSAAAAALLKQILELLSGLVRQPCDFYNVKVQN